MQFSNFHTERKISRISHAVYKLTPRRNLSIVKSQFPNERKDIANYLTTKKKEKEWRLQNFPVGKHCSEECKSREFQSAEMYLRGKPGILHYHTIIAFLFGTTTPRCRESTTLGGGEEGGCTSPFPQIPRKPKLSRSIGLGLFERACGQTPLG